MTPDAVETGLLAWQTRRGDTAERDALICAAYRAGININRIHTLSGEHRDTIYAALRRDGIEPTTREDLGVAVLTLTHHPFQRVGAHAVAKLAGRRHPTEVRPGDLDAVADRIVTDAVMAATATKGGPGWAWLQRLAMCYAQSPATHPVRAKRGAAGVEAALRPMFDPDTDPIGPCWTCGRPAGQRWDKQAWPLLEARSHVNYGGAQLACRACRVAVWAMPYGAWALPGREVLTVTGPEAGEADIVAANLAVAQQMTAERWRSMPEGLRMHDTALPAILARPDDYELQRWVNTNREQAIRVTSVTRTLAVWLAETERANPGLLAEIADKRDVLDVVTQVGQFGKVAAEKALAAFKAGDRRRVRALADALIAYATSVHP